MKTINTPNIVGNPERKSGNIKFHKYKNLLIVLLIIAEVFQSGKQCNAQQGITILSPVGNDIIYWDVNYISPNYYYTANINIVFNCSGIGSVDIQLTSCCWDTSISAFPVTNSLNYLSVNISCIQYQGEPYFNDCLCNLTISESSTNSYSNISYFIITLQSIYPVDLTGKLIFQGSFCSCVTQELHLCNGTLVSLNYQYISIPNIYENQYLQVHGYYGYCTDPECNGGSTFILLVYSPFSYNPCQLIVTDQIENVLCYGDSTGLINLTITGGTGPYQFLWSNSATTEDIDNLAAGTYYVTIIDNSVDTVIYTVLIAQPDPITLIPEIHQPCFGLTDGSIMLQVTGGTSPYNYHWNNNSYSQNIISLPVGTYSVTVTDSNLCLTSDTFYLVQNPVISTNGVVTHVQCFEGSDGSINLTPGGGSPPYTFLWSNGSNTEDISNLSYGTYSVIVTDSNNCDKTTVFSVGQPPELIISGNVTNVYPCHGDSSGEIQLSISGGITPYFYFWNNGATIDEIAQLPADTYSVTVTDDNGCHASTDFIVDEPELAINITYVLTQPLNGNDGAIDLSVNGGVSPYFFTWSNGSFSEDLYDIASGTYIVTVTDQIECNATATIVLYNADITIISGKAGQLISYYSSTRNTIYLIVMNVEQDNYSLAIYRSDGTLSYELKNVLIFSNYNRFELNADTYKPGIYLIQLHSQRNYEYSCKMHIIK
jgi:hypothetical protein